MFGAKGERPVTWILAVATIGVLGSIAVAVHRAAADAAERVCDCRYHSPEPAVGIGGGPSPDGGSRRHLRVVA